MRPCAPKGEICCAEKNIGSVRFEAEFRQRKKIPDQSERHIKLIFIHMSDLGVVQRGQGLLPPAADLPQRGAVAPLVPRQAQAAGLVHALRRHPGDPLRQD